MGDVLGGALLAGVPQHAQGRDAVDVGQARQSGVDPLGGERVLPPDAGGGGQGARDAVRAGTCRGDPQPAAAPGAAGCAVESATGGLPVSGPRAGSVIP